MRSPGKASRLNIKKRLKELASVDGGTMQALFEDGTTARGDFVVGADGAHSSVRQVIFPGGPRPSFLGVLGVGGFVSPSVIVAADAADRRSLNFTVGSAGQFGYCNIGQNQNEEMDVVVPPSPRQRADER
jgi:2-polyprenyl-6-methoxyphenol hydroxylase-like FAD-dependent oxidoreductase